MASISILFGGKEQSQHELDKPRMVAGREPSCEIHIDNLGISREHCCFLSRGEAYVVQDLGSANGTYVNGKKIVEHYLNNGDEVMIGKYTLKFNNEKQAQVAPQREDAGVPDTLNTYVMDGAKIQEQLAKMRSQAPADTGAGKAPAPPQGQPVTAKDYARALDVSGPRPDSQMGSLKTMLIVAIAGIFLLLIALIVILLLKLK